MWFHWRQNKSVGRSFLLRSAQLFVPPKLTCWQQTVHLVHLLPKYGCCSIGGKRFDTIPSKLWRRWENPLTGLFQSLHCFRERDEQLWFRFCLPYSKLLYHRRRAREKKPWPFLPRCPDSLWLKRLPMDNKTIHSWDTPVSFPNNGKHHLQTILQVES